MTDKTHRFAARKNALVVATALAGLAAWNLYRHRLLRVEVLGGLALMLFLVAVCSPYLTERFNQGWMALAKALGYVNSRIMLSLVYYLVLTPFGIILRLRGHDTLCRRAQQRESYWIPRQTPRQPTSGFERSF